ncbi:histidine kinase [Nonomuraea sp. ATR24]|uniref:sensor histidine kinase n=1 Tax=Nonomuraea TaxID=83681 RepID=UPI0027E0FC39|nr:histidine kinase [Nonomuraea ceibae]
MNGPEHAPEYRWALPSVLLGDGGAGRPVRRSTRDWIVDLTLFLGACGLTLMTLAEIRDAPEPVQAVEQALGVLSCLAVWLRRRWPVALALVTLTLSSSLLLIGGAAVVALFTVAVHRPFKISGPVALLGVLTLAPNAMIWPDAELGWLGTFVFGLAILLTVFAWGIVIRARRQLVWSLRQRADGAAEEARRLERERIAREMHDVLAHRLSMLSLHAGALEFRPGAPEAEVARAAGAIRQGAHQALQDLREVIGVLRHSGAPADDPVPDRPQPTLDDLPALVAECRRAGLDVRLDLHVDPPAEVSAEAPSDVRAAAPVVVSTDAPVAVPAIVPADVPAALPTGAPPVGPAAGGFAPSEMPASPEGPAPYGGQRLPEALGRNVYRIVQEALTNARKHAGGAPATVTVTGAPGRGLSAEVRNALGSRHNALGSRHAARIPGAGAGLIGLAERAELAGGRLEHGPTPDGEFVVRAWLPWPCPEESA